MPVTFTTTLPAPSGTSLDTSIEDEITVSWTDNADDENGYKVHRSQDGTNFTVVADLAANTTSYTDTGLEDGEKYWYYVEVYTEDTSSTGSTVSGTTVLPSPSGISLDTSVEDEITVSWTNNDDSIDGASEILRSTDGSTGMSVATLDTSTTSYTDAGLDDGETYYYTVRRVTDHDTADSSQESGTTILPAPSGTSLDTSVEDEITISWTDNSDGENGFEIFRSEDGTNFSSLTTVGANTESYTDTGLEDGEKYWYYVQVNGSDATAAGSTVSGVTVLPAPSGVSLDTSVEDEITVSWTNNDDSGDGNIEVMRSQDGSTGSSVTSFSDLTTTSYTDTGLEDGEQYHYTVRRSTDHATSDSTQVSGVTVLPAPTSVTADASVEDEISLSWTNNDDSSDGTIEVMRSQDGSPGSSVQSFTDLTTTSYTDTGLEDGETFYYTIRRSTDHATSDATQVDATTVLPSPSGVSLDTSVEDEITVSWTNNDDSGDGSIEVMRSQDGSTGTSVASLGVDDTSYTDTGLEDGEEYHYTIRRSTAHTSADSGQQSGVTVLPAPTGISLDASIEDEITVSWSNNDDSSDGTIEILRSEDGTTGSSVSSISTLSTTSYTDTGLEDGEKYYYTVRRSTDHATSDTTQASARTVLPAPSGVSLDASTEDEITVSWSNNDDSSDGTIEILRSEDGSTGSSVSSISTLSTTSYTDGSLEDGEKYYYTVRRSTDHATSDSSQVNAVTVLPGPSSFSLSAPSEGTLDLSWTRNDDSPDGSVKISRSSDNSTWETAATLTPSATSYTEDREHRSADNQATVDPGDNLPVSFTTVGHLDSEAEEAHVYVKNNSDSSSASDDLKVELTDSEGGILYSDTVSVSLDASATTTKTVSLEDTDLSRGSSYTVTAHLQNSTSLGIDEITADWEQFLRDGETMYYEVKRLTSHASQTVSGNQTTILPAPSSVSLDTSVEDEITVSWGKLDNNPNGDFEVFRSQDGSLGSSQTVHTDLSNKNYTDTGLEDGEEFYYTVRRDTPDTASDSSQVSGITVLPAPSSVSIDDSTEDELTVSWTNNDDSADGAIRVYRSTDGSKGSEVASFSDLTTTSYTETGLPDGEKYCYTIERDTNTTTSDAPQESAITVLPAPTGLSVSNIGEHSADLSWTVNHDNGDQTVQYRKSSESTWQDFSTGLARTTSTESLTGLDDGEEYDARVLAVTSHTTTQDA